MGERVGHRLVGDPQLRPRLVIALRVIADVERRSCRCAQRNRTAALGTWPARRPLPRRSRCRPADRCRPGRRPAGSPLRCSPASRTAEPTPSSPAGAGTTARPGVTYPYRAVQLTGPVPSRPRPLSKRVTGLRRRRTSESAQTSHPDDVAADRGLGWLLLPGTIINSGRTKATDTATAKPIATESLLLRSLGPESTTP